MDTHTTQPQSTPVPNLKSISGVVERITYHNEETGYTVARLLPERRSDRESTGASTARDGALVTVVGNMPGVVAGEVLELSGVWKSHPQHGWQFTVEGYRAVLPATAQGIRKYLGSGLIKGIGPRTAEKIVDHFDVATLDILEENPERLREAPGLGPHRARLIAAAWAQQKAIKEVMVFLQGQGISTSLAVRIYKHYGDGAINVVKNDPYRMAREVWGIGFKTADKIAQALGYSLDDPERLKAGTLFVLSEASDSGGHTYLPRPQLAEKAAELLGVGAGRIEEAIDALVLDGGARVETISEGEDGGAAFEPLVAVHVFEPEAKRLLREGGAEYKPDANDRVASETEARSPGASRKAGAASEIEEYVASTPTLSALPGEQAVYLPPFYYSEQGIAHNLLRLAGCPPARDRLADLASIDFEVMFEYLATKERLHLSERQQDGVRMALTEPVGVLTGGPGTGKTTSMRALIRVLTLKKKKVMLAAPTGRAAKRLSETTGLEAKTLHRLLALRPGGKAQYDAANPIPADVIIVDEASMLDSLLMNTLLKGIPTGSHLLLVGDADQLPSVGAGNVLADVLRSGTVPVVRLDQIFRQSEGSAIIENAHRINQGLMPVTGKGIKDFFLFAEDDPERAGELVVDLVRGRIPARFGYSPSDIQVLAPMHGGRCGVAALNERLQEALNPPSEQKGQKQYGGKLFRVGDKVLALRNNYDKDVYNGDAGALTAISHEDQEAVVRLDDGRVVTYEFGELDELALAYALSVHKSQGSEYPVCVIPVLMSHYMLLERKLLYTAVTRAKQLVVLVGSRRALAIAVKNGPNAGEAGAAKSAGHRGGRYTGLMTRLAQKRGGAVESASSY